jgi:hypothetical protein
MIKWSTFDDVWDAEVGRIKHSSSGVGEFNPVAARAIMTGNVCKRIQK